MPVIYQPPTLRSALLRLSLISEQGSAPQVVRPPDQREIGIVNPGPPRGLGIVNPGPPKWVGIVDSGTPRAVGIVTEFDRQRARM